MGTPEQELESLENLARASSQALANLIIVHNDAMRFLRKLHDRAHPSILDDNSQTRLDPDILEELETLLSLTNDSEETRPD